MLSSWIRGQDGCLIFTSHSGQGSASATAHAHLVDHLLIAPEVHLIAPEVHLIAPEVQILKQAKRCSDQTVSKGTKILQQVRRYICI